jgi:enoyl-CoA hydratase
MMAYEHILTELDEPLAIVTLNRPKVLNALNHDLIRELADALEAFDQDPRVRCMILTGSERAFAAGADITQMVDAGAVDVLIQGQFGRWARLRNLSKPLIAAVSGYAFGGGCELALICDLIVASETAQFGQPEIKIGIIPGAGGTQRLTRTLGKARAMEMVLTGNPITAQQALAGGLVNRVAPVATYLDEAKALGREIAARAPVAVRLGKEAVNQALETSLETGLAYERKLFYLLFASEDKREGMRAFLDKRRPAFTGR